MSRAFSFRRRRFRPLSGLERGIIVAAVVSVVVILKPDWIEATLNTDLPPLPSATAASLPSPSAAHISGHARIVDGDGLEIGSQSIRLHGVDAFEMRQMCGGHACGQASANALRTLVGGRSVDCVEMDRDRYGRVVAVCHAGGQDLGAAMVRQGHAVAYTRYSQRYVLEERAARRDNAGAWAYGFTQPEAWRRAS
jgi:endonuclease YncB( thermonuclease family)